MTNEYIGVLDSGVGGLSILSELYKIMPDKNYIYVGDTKNLPYGTKTPAEIYSFTKDILNYFLKNNVKNVVIACNTTSAVAYDKLKKEFENRLRIFPLIQSIASSAIEGLKDNDTIALLATRATVNSKKYEQEINKINPKIKVISIDCTGFVEIVENRLYSCDKSIELIKSKLDIAKNNNAKRVILGCTHYPYLVDIFKKILNVEYFNPATSLAKKVKKEINFIGNGEIKFYSTINPDEFKKSAKMFFDIKDDVELISF